VRPLDEEERIDELARMLGGVRITRQTRDHAREMLGQGQRAATKPRKRTKRA
jgi:DNA repair protein RecN (Recombination protein N)